MKKILLTLIPIMMLASCAPTPITSSQSDSSSVSTSSSSKVDDSQSSEPALVSSWPSEVQDFIDEYIKEFIPSLELDIDTLVVSEMALSYGYGLGIYDEGGVNSLENYGEILKEAGFAYKTTDMYGFEIYTKDDVRIEFTFFEGDDMYAAGNELYIMSHNHGNQPTTKAEAYEHLTTVSGVEVEELPDYDLFETFYTSWYYEDTYGLAGIYTPAEETDFYEYIEVLSTTHEVFEDVEYYNSYYIDYDYYQLDISYEFGVIVFTVFTSL